SSNYHSLQSQLTMRPKHGVTAQATWTWSRATGVAPPTGDGGGTTETYRDFMNRHADYTVASFQRTHDLRGYATFELPFGPGRLVGSGSHGALARIIEGWQLGTILDFATGAPLNAITTTTINRSGTPDIVGAFPRNGHVVWKATTRNPFGNYLCVRVTRVSDPGWAKPTMVANNNNGPAQSLNSFCTNSAIVDANGNIILQNAAPGQLGTLGLNPIYGPGSWNFDANLQ